MRLVATADFPTVLPKLLEFERRSFGDYPYTPAPERLTLWWKTGNFFLAGVEDEKGQLNSLFTVFLTTQDQYELFKGGELSSSKVMAPHPGTSDEEVIIYMPTLIVGDRYWMPAIFKSLAKELETGMKARKLHATSIFATAVDKRSLFLLNRSGFKIVGSYKDGYKILTADRQSSPIFKNFVR